jgi:signal transduction histidine kinase/sensor domain CHASE-containing protein
MKLSKAEDKHSDLSAVTRTKPSQVLHLVRRAAIYISFAGLLLFCFSKFEELSYQNYLRELKLEAITSLVEVRESIENNLSAKAQNITNLAVTIAENPTLNQTEFNIKAVDYVLENPAILNVSTAPDFVVEMVFPRYGNENVIGYDLRDDKAQYAKVQEALRTGEGFVTGPVDLIEGKRGVIMRKPVFAKGRSGVPHAWGVVSVVLDYEKLLSNLNIPEFEKKFDIVIQETSATGGQSSEVLFGDTSIFEKDPIRLGFNFLFGQWELVATPDGGWPTHQPNHIWRWMVGCMVILSCLFALWYLIRLVDKRLHAESVLSTGIEALDHGFVMFDADRRLVAFNQKYKELAGASGMVRVGVRYEDIVKANLKKGLIPDAVGREKEWLEKWSKRLVTKASDNEQILADGRLIRATDRPMEDGSTVGLRIDITDLKKAQIAAEAANKAKTDFMGVLSHELRTPLTVILGNAKLAKNISMMPAYRNLVAKIQAHPDLNDEFMPLLEKINDQIGTMMGSLENSGNHLFSLISEILDFTKIDSGNLVLEKKPTSSTEIVGSVVDQLRPLVEQRGLQIVTQIEDVRLVADLKRIQQILINVIGNATKFTDSGTITLAVCEKDDKVIFSVTDTGIGIPEDQIDRVFEAFQQVDSTARRKYGGTGLGLAISRDIAVAHEGQLTLKSKLGQGSTFTLVLPCNKSDIEPEYHEEMIESLVA